MAARLRAWRYYVYEVRRGESVVYVGKGCGRRGAYSAKARGGCLEIVAYFKHEAHALQFERERIASRIREGHRLQNIANGNAVSWWRRTDSREMAREVLEETARKVGTWIKAGKLDALSQRLKMPEYELVSLYQQFGS